MNAPLAQKCNTCGSTDIRTVDHEIVCGGCGIVLDENFAIEETGPKSTLSLYHTVETGGRPVKTEFTKRIHETQSDVSLLSNACKKLDLPNNVALDARATYVKIMKTGKGFSRAQVACFALFTACRRSKIPKSDNDIQTAVNMNFGVSREFTMLKVFTTLKGAALELGIPCDYDNSEYYLNLRLVEAQKKFGNNIKFDFDRIKRMAYSNFQKLSGSNDTKARIAVTKALAGIELK